MSIPPSKIKSDGKSKSDIIYNSALRYIEDVMGNGVTSDGQLDSAGKIMFGRKWSGVYSADERPIFDIDKKYAIMNLDPRFLPGSHWIGLIKTGNDLLVYDSFGRKSSKIIPSIFRGGQNIIDTEYDSEQNVKEDNCGQRTLIAIFIFDQFGREMFLQL